MSEEHTIDSLELPHILFAVQDGETQFSFYFRGFEKEQVSEAGIFGISLYEIGIEADIVCSIHMEDVYAFYCALRQCCEGKVTTAVLSDTQDEHIRMTIAFDNAGRGDLKGFVCNRYNGNASVVHFDLQCEQIDCLPALSQFAALFEQFKA